MDIPIRGWTFTHWWVRPVVKVWFRLYHKTVTYSGTDQVDWSKPIIFAPSHQSAFTDALCLILPTRYTNDRFIYPLIRADAFGNNRAVDWVLTAFHMMPVYRPKDNVDIRKRNDTVFSDCHDILSRNRNLLIHPEGNCFAVKKVRRFKKGLARIALGAEALHDFGLGVTVVPVGINYRKLTEARGGIHIRFGNPVAVSEFEREYREQEASAIVNLTNRVEEEVKRVTVDIQSDEQYSLIEELMNLFKNSSPDYSANGVYTQEEVFYEKKIIEHAERRLTNSQQSKRIKSQVQKIKELLRNFRLDAKEPLTNSRSALGLAFEGLGYLVSTPLLAYGWINNILPWLLTHRLASKIDDAQFVNSIRMVSGLLIFPTFYLIQTLIFGMVSANPMWTLLYFISLPLTGILSLNILEHWKRWRQRFKLNRLTESQKKRLENSLKELSALLGIS